MGAAVGLRDDFGADELRRLAATAYHDGLGLAVGEVTRDDDRGVLTATVRPPKGGVIELVSAVS